MTLPAAAAPHNGRTLGRAYAPTCGNDSAIAAAAGEWLAAPE
jgi:hypothetical protein